MIIITNTYTIKKHQAYNVIEKCTLHVAEKTEDFLGQEVVISDHLPDYDEVIISMRFLSKNAAECWQNSSVFQNRSCSDEIISCKMSIYEVKAVRS